MQILKIGFRFGPALLAAFLGMSALNPPTVCAQNKSALVNVNTADLATLETLPGIGPATAQKIIDGRPYKNAADLERVSGLSKEKIDALHNQITFGHPTTTPATKPPVPSAAKGGLVNVNTADLATLETLPGIGPATAQKIVAGRPYHTMADLEKVDGLSKSKVDAIKNQITLGSPSTKPKTTPAKSTEVKPDSSKTLPATGHETPPKLAPGQKVNINTATAEQLDGLFGIGPVKSQAIVDYRKQNGSFKTIEDIMKVDGIKEGEFAKIKDYIRVK